MKVLIADDELDVLKGLKHIINWQNLGFDICGETLNGEKAFKMILELQPDLVILDIKMPKISGLDVVRMAKEHQFSGKFIILSGYSNFNYAKTSIQYGVDFYITKPIDEEELESAVISVRDRIQEEQRRLSTLSSYREKAKKLILQDILKNKANYSSLELQDLYQASTIYQIILYENFNYNNHHNILDLPGILRESNYDNNSFEYISFDGKNIILLKGDFAIKSFEHLLQKYEYPPQKDSLLDLLFFACGRKVYQISNVHLSYKDSLTLMERRFYCKPSQHIISSENLPESNTLYYNISSKITSEYSQLFIDYIQTHNRSMIIETLGDLEKKLYHSTDSTISVKYFLADIFIQVKLVLTHLYNKISIPFPTNAIIIEFIEKQYYIYEIMNFFKEQFIMCMNAVSSSSSDSILGELLYYISHNYRENLKLEHIAPLFGYNSSYLGKLFSKKIGKNFNSYLDQIRVDKSKKLLAENKLKVYEVAEKIGYKNVDYFHKKFKKHVGISPAEYRKKLL